MAFRRPSKTTATGAQPADPRRAHGGSANRAVRAQRAVGTFRSLIALGVTVLAVTLLPTAGCSSSSPPLARAGDQLVAGRTVSVDFDGDGVGELVCLAAENGGLVLTDGPTVYRSRDKWRVVEAFIADADGNGLLEVTALLESSDGRHLGLFAWMGDRYRERLVTSPLTPRPLSLRIIPVDDGPLAESEGQQATSAPDLVGLTEESEPGGAVVETTYRWNGFGLTAVDRTVQ